VRKEGDKCCERIDYVGKGTKMFTEKLRGGERQTRVERSGFSYSASSKGAMRRMKDNHN